MFLRLEKPARRMDGSWSTDIELVNSDRVARLSVETDTIKEKVFTLLVVSSESARLGRYYFGPEGMTVAETDKRLGELRRAMNSDGPVVWTMRKDAESRSAGEALPDAA